ncbi:MAG: type II secretion system protein [bacterium]|nr:type II secretion system protein [bacterium]
MRKSLGFTLAEVLITLAIIGVVAAMTIPSVIVNTNQSEFKTGLRKAVSVLNSSLTMNIALEGESPYDNSNLFGYLQQHMSVMKSTTKLDFAENNYAFYTTDGMRFEFPTAKTTKVFKLHENGDTIYFNETTMSEGGRTYIGECGSAGLATNVNDTKKGPCMVMVDVNGDRKPNPANASVNNNTYSYPGPTEKLLKDVFTIMITDEKAVPLGVAAQKAMYQAQK